MVKNCQYLAIGHTTSFYIVFLFFLFFVYFLFWLTLFFLLQSSTAVTPWNPLLFGCHAVNEVAQLGQAFRWTNYWYFGGHERAIANAPKTEEPVAAPVKKE